jgi:hypothetical protein
MGVVIPVGEHDEGCGKARLPVPIRSFSVVMAGALAKSGGLRGRLRGPPRPAGRVSSGDRMKGLLAFHAGSPCAHPGWAGAGSRTVGRVRAEKWFGARVWRGDGSGDGGPGRCWRWMSAIGLAGASPDGGRESVGGRRTCGTRPGRRRWRVLAANRRHRPLRDQRHLTAAETTPDAASATGAVLLPSERHG